MEGQGERGFFGREHAAAHEKHYARWAPLRTALHLLIGQVLLELPAEARILCVGAGIGPELIDLAHAFPGWQFTAVEPSAPMLEICRRRAEESGVASRCTFHHGYLDTLPASAPFDAATSILVSQFILQPEERRRFFGQIAGRLRAGGYLVSADLAYGQSGPASDELLQVWLRLQHYTGVPADQLEKLVAALETSVAVSAADDLERMIEAGGFQSPVRFFQALLIHAWFARRDRRRAPRGRFRHPSA
ncbi:MAG: class I SAM-dependent methyltransferase [Armatimonadota bacterium]